ncbi:MAG: Wzz/FepE/Etk N-terminal domain-containing protein, partial [Chitinophagaceae bacterium]
MSNNNTTIILDTEKKATPIEIIFLYLSYLPLFIVSLALCLTAAFIYLRYQKPVFKNTALMYVKPDDKTGGSIRGASGSGDLIDAAMLGGGKRVNLENEIELIKSRSLMQRVVEKNNLNIQYYSIGKVNTLETNEDDVPFTFKVIRVKDSTNTYAIRVRKINNS